MNKPKKKNLKGGKLASTPWYNKGFNRACDLWQAYHNEVLEKLARKEEIEKLINKMMTETAYEVDDYELRADNGDYSPNEHERMLIEDFHQGFVDELYAIFPKIIATYIKEAK